jgi:hypothetical protein
MGGCFKMSEEHYATRCMKFLQYIADKRSIAAPLEADCKTKPKQFRGQDFKEACERVIKHKADGVNTVSACKREGVNPQSFRDYLRRKGK